MRIKVLVVCEELLTAHSQSARLAQFADIHANATTFKEVLRVSGTMQPDVLLVEHVADQEHLLWHMLERLGRRSPNTRTVMLARACSDQLIASIVAHGISGYLDMKTELSLLVKAIRAVCAGESWFAHRILYQALRQQLSADVLPDLSNAERALLTGRERQILSLIGAGLSNKEIARELVISDHTVKTHLHHIYVKLDRSGRYKAFTVSSNSPTAGARVHATPKRRVGIPNLLPPASLSSPSIPQ